MTMPILFQRSRFFLTSASLPLALGIAIPSSLGLNKVPFKALTCLSSPTK